MKQNAVGLANICVLSTVVLIAEATTGIEDNIFFDTNLSIEDSKKLSHDIQYIAVSENDENYIVTCTNRYNMSEELTQMYGGLFLKLQYHTCIKKLYMLIYSLRVEHVDIGVFKNST